MRCLEIKYPEVWNKKKQKIIRHLQQQLFLLLMSMTILDNDFCSDAPTKRKIELCKSWTEEGYCRYGDACFFAHGIDQLIRYQPALRKKICRNFHQHKYCKFGSRCNFVHEIKEVTEITRTKSFEKMLEEFPELITHMRFRKSLLQFL